MISTTDINRYCPEYSAEFSAIEADINNVYASIKEIIGNYDIANVSESDVNILKEAIANLAVAEYVNHSVNITQSGIQRIETDKFKTAFKYERNNLVSFRTERGYQCLERFLYVLCKYTNFVATDAYQHITKRLLNFNFEVSRNAGITMPYSVFQSILPIVELIETEVVIPLLGDVLYNRLKAMQYKNITENTLTQSQKYLLADIKGALAQYAIQIAIENNMIVFNGNQVSQRETDAHDQTAQYKTPSVDYYQIVLNTKREYTNRFFYKIKMFLISNAERLGWTAPTTQSKITPSTDTQKLKSIW